MKLLTLTVGIIGPFCAFAILGISQESKAQPERLHIQRSSPDGSAEIRATASTIERGLSSKETESLIHLRGNVEVRMITCARTGRSGHDDSRICGQGSMLLHADEVDYNEKTGRIDARGNVHVEPFRYPEKVASK